MSYFEPNKARGNKSHVRYNTTIGIESSEFSTPHIALLHTLSQEDAAFQQYNSCVEYTFRNDGNARKLTQLSKIFQKAADKDVRGIREDKLISLLPRDKVGKFGLSASLEKLECTHHRYLSRGTFMAMFSNESASFIFNMAQNERAIRLGKEVVKERGQTLPIEMERRLSKENYYGEKSEKEGRSSKQSKKKSRKKKKSRRSKRKEDSLHSQKNFKDFSSKMFDHAQLTDTSKDRDSCHIFENFSRSVKNFFPSFAGNAVIVPID